MSDTTTARTRLSIREPIPEIFEAYYLLSAAADAHLHGQFAAAETLFARANITAVYDWAWTDWRNPRLNIRVSKPENDTSKVPSSERDKDLGVAQKRALVARDGHCCRYCGIPVIDADVRKLVHKWYAEAVPWRTGAPEKQHSAFSCMWLQYDHIVPLSHGGHSNEDNVVVSCALCNFGKQEFTLRQLDIADPRLRPPVPTRWDGLERLRGCT
jgi:5-methylcytosine-specific restriction endonuclease McrA